MTRTLLLSFGLACSIAIITLPAGAETIVSGPVSGVWTLEGSPYVATDSLEVPDGDSLRIEPGVQVFFRGSYALMVYGGLHAAGTEAGNITFARHDESLVPWTGIRFRSADPGCFLEYCRISGAAVDGDSIRTACGGGIYSEDTSPSISHCWIEDCESQFWGLSEGYGGGAIYCLGGEPRIVGNQIRNCYAEGSCLGGGGAICVVQANALIHENKITDCGAHGCSGGIACYDSRIEITENIIWGCVGFHYGGGLALISGCTGVVFDNLIAENEVADLYGGGVFIEDSDITLSFCTIADNIGGQPGYGSGGGIYFSGSAQPEIDYCILWGNTSSNGAQIWPPDLWMVSYCDIEGGYSGAGNFSEDPLFASEGVGGARTYFLSCIEAGQNADSPCIDAANCSAQDADLDQRTTRTDFVLDAGIADLGYHYESHGSSDLPLAVVRPGLKLSTAPNPFHGQTTIRLLNNGNLENPARVRILDAAGRLLRILDLGPDDGAQTATWDGRDGTGHLARPGVYFLQTEPANTVAVGGKVILCR